MAQRVARVTVARRADSAILPLRVTYFRPAPRFAISERSGMWVTRPLS